MSMQFGLHTASDEIRVKCSLIELRCAVNSNANEDILNVLEILGARPFQPSAWNEADVAVFHELEDFMDS